VLRFVRLLDVEQHAEGPPVYGALRIGPTVDCV